MENSVASTLTAAALSLTLGFWILNFRETLRTWGILRLRDKKIVWSGGLRLLLRGLGLIFLALALWAPSLFFSKRLANAYTQNIYFLLDVSASMRAQDVLPSRFAKAKEILYNLAELFKGSQLGLIPFCSFAEVYCPLTRDIDLFKQIVSAVDIEQFNPEGASFRKGLSKAEESFEQDSATDSKIIIIITDGENNNEHFLSLVSKLQKQDYSIFCITVGSDSGAKIPLGSEGGFLRNPSNNELIISSTDPNFSASLTTEGKCYTFKDYPSLAQQALAKRYMQLEDVIQYSVASGGFRAFLLCGILAIVLSFFIKPL